MKAEQQFPIIYREPKKKKEILQNTQIDSIERAFERLSTVFVESSLLIYCRETSQQFCWLGRSILGRILW